MEAKKKEAFQAKLADIFCTFHRHPELSYHEVETTKRLRTLLTDAGIRILDLPLKTGLAAEIGHGKPVLALRTDIDALPIEEQTELPYRSENPGVMHACGHDFHMTSVLGAALLLKQKEDELPGTVRVIFQPAEEAPGGAKDILESGALDDVQAIFGFHCQPTMEIGTISAEPGATMASVDQFVFHFRGKGAHAAHPDRGVDVITMTAAFIQSVQTIVSRNLNPLHPGLISLTHIEAGNTWNVLPDEALVEGTERAMSAEERADMKKRLLAQAEYIAKAYGGEVSVDWHAGPPAIDNKPEWAALSRKVGEACGLKVIETESSLAGEDFAYYQEKIPGCFVFVGTGLSYSNHHPKFQVDPSALAPTAEYLAALVRAAFSEV